jgi:hypothetical protein
MMLNLQFVFWAVVALLGLVVAPIVMIVAAVQHFRGRGGERVGTGGISAGIGAAMQELDRLMTRPSAEFHIDAKSEKLEREDDSGDPQ